MILNHHHLSMKRLLSSTDFKNRSYINNFHPFIANFAVFVTIFLPVEGITSFGDCFWIPESKGVVVCSKFNNTFPNISSKAVENFIEPIIKSLGGQSVSDIKSIYINESFVPILDLIQFSEFPSLTHLSVINSNVCHIQGTVPVTLRFLDLSYNIIMSKDIDPLIFKNSILQEIDFSYNKLIQLPESTLGLNLKSLSLIGNDIQCNWVSKPKFYNWASKNQKVIKDIDKTFCLPDDIAFESMTILSALKLRQKASEECQKTICECDIWATLVGDEKFPSKNYPVIHSNQYANISMTLRFDCANLGLSDLPSISPYTVILSLDSNSIQDLNRLNTDKNYGNVNSIFLNHNQIENLDSIVQSAFFDRVRIFEVKNNTISHISENLITTIFSRSNSERMVEKIAIGENEIYCDCNTFTKLKPRLVAYEHIIRDWKSVRCLSPNVTLMDLRYDQACPLDEDESDWIWWIVVGIEGGLIMLILVKLWSDRREYRRTGQLPLLSSCIPRLPCDFILEGIKDNHHNKN